MGVVPAGLGRCGAGPQDSALARDAIGRAQLSPRPALRAAARADRSGRRSARSRSYLVPFSGIGGGVYPGHLPASTAADGSLGFERAAWM